ncbi:MAG: peptidoglycan-binding domain-containing protein, partial [Acidimicrobiales bacterium]
IWMPDRADGGDPEAIVRRASEVGLTHLYVRTGTLKEGFMGGPFLDRLLPVAHANRLRVYGWDFPYLDHPGDDVNRALAAIRYTTPDGHRVDGFSADIESTSEGTNNDLEYVTAYVNWLRQNVGPNYPLVATVPNPTARKVASGFPYAEILAPFDAVAPMVYWMNRDPAADAANAVRYLSRFAKPVFPIGQAYDGGPEGGPPGVPSRRQIIAFMQAAERNGAAGVSFWSWQHADQEAWDAVRDAAEFRLDLGGPEGEGLTAGMIRAYQTALTRLGFPVQADGTWGPATVEALLSYQRAARLAASGLVDAATHSLLLTPVPAPLRPG